MEELYRIIEQKIKDAGYPKSISGEMVYGDICNQIEGKENGSYVLLSNLKMMLFLNTILLLWMMNSILGY